MTMKQELVFKKTNIAWSFKYKKITNKMFNQTFKKIANQTIPLLLPGVARPDQLATQADKRSV